MRRHRAWRVERREQLFAHPVLSLERRHLRAEDDDSRRQALVLEAPRWVNVIALLAEPPAPRVVLVRQWRYAVGETTLEIPGGMVDPGEDEAAAARRELLEETGYGARRWRRLGEVQPNPALFSNCCGTWLAEELERVGEPSGDGDEEIAVETAALADVPRLIAAGTIAHALVVAAFFLLRIADDGR